MEQRTSKNRTQKLSLTQTNFMIRTGRYFSRFVMFFKKFCVFVLSVAVYCATAADEAWSGNVFLRGVSADGGYGNVKKYNVVGGGRDDSEMCSAAAAASVMTWWLNTREGANLTQEQIYAMYDRMCGYTNWTTTTASRAWTSYCQDVFGTTCNKIADYVTPRLYVNSALNTLPFYDACDYVASDIYRTMGLDDVVQRGIENGYGMTLRLVREQSNMGHTVSLWGGNWANVGGQSYITALAFTDSDSNGGLTWGTVTAKAVEGNASSGMGSYTDYYLNAGGMEWRIAGVDYLFHTRDQEPDSPVVPEPSSVLLLAIVGVGVVSRRRRR